MTSRALLSYLLPGVMTGAGVAWAGYLPLVSGLVVAGAAALIGALAGRLARNPRATIDDAARQPAQAIWVTLLIGVSGALAAHAELVGPWLTGAVAAILVVAATWDRAGARATHGVLAAALGFLSFYVALDAGLLADLGILALAAIAGGLGALVLQDHLSADRIRARLLVAVGALVIAQPALLLPLLPLEPWAVAASATALTYFWVGMLAQAAAGRLTRRLGLEYAGVTLLTTILVGVLGQ